MFEKLALSYSVTISTLNKVLNTKVSKTLVTKWVIDGTTY